MRRHLPRDRLQNLLDRSTGLTPEEVVARRARYGPNDIVAPSEAGWQVLLRDTARDPMIWFLIGTASLFAWLGDYVEAAVLATALLPIAGMDAYLHRRTQASTESLASRIAATARVLRGDDIVVLPAAELVPGDLVLVAAGDPVPADGLLLAAEGVQADESALTGEALPVRKAALAGEAAIDGLAVGDRHWMLAGTRLLTGEARLRLVHTGRETLYGEIVRSAQLGRHERTPLQRTIGSLVAVLLVVALAICVALAATRIYQGHGIVDAFVSAVTLAVAALPEEFPVVFAFFLGVGVYRLAKRQALVRRAVAVENIGRVSCICSDKTGTLTVGELRLAHLAAAPGIAEERLLRAAATASRTTGGDPLDAAILASGERQAGEVVAVFPFTEDRRREVTIVRIEGATLYCAGKGAPETMLGLSQVTAEEVAAWDAAVKSFAVSGHKVIACAERTLPESAWAGGEPDRGYSFLGLIAFEDPLRDGAAEAVAMAMAAGIRVIMLTGDHPATARAIATELGLGAGALNVLEGRDLQEAADLADSGILRDVDVIARLLPAQKLDIVRALQRTGELVAVTGDGVNDVPALQGADIGIAMGERGTRSAREVAAIVLLDDNFRTIVRAIAEGRQLYRNLKLSFAYLLMVHMPLVATAALIPFAGFPLLYLPVHIVWLELIIHPTALLVFQREAPEGALDPHGGGAGPRFFGALEWLVVALTGVAITLAVVAGYDYSLGLGRNVEEARAMALVTLILAGSGVTAGLSGLSTLLAAVIAAGSILSAFVATQIPALAALLHLAPLHVDDWLLAAGAGAVAGAMAACLPRLSAGAGWSGIAFRGRRPPGRR